jgi:hypothetical protein
LKTQSFQNCGLNILILMGRRVRILQHFSWLIIQIKLVLEWEKTGKDNSATRGKGVLTFSVTGSERV